MKLNSLHEKRFILLKKLKRAYECAQDFEERELFKMLCDLLDFYDREQIPPKSRLKKRLDMTLEQLYCDADCLVDLERTSKNPYPKSPKDSTMIYEYRYSVRQPFIGKDRDFYMLYSAPSEITNMDISLEITREEFCPKYGKISFSQTNEQTYLPQKIHIIPNENFPYRILMQAMWRAMDDIVIDSNNVRAVVDFLYRRNPRFRSVSINPPLPVRHENLLEDAKQAVRSLDHSYLSIQGPPGTGKTYTAARIILHLLAHNKAVGISSNSHKAINKLLEEVVCARREEDGFRISSILTQIDKEARPTYIKVQNEKYPILEYEEISYVRSGGGLKSLNLKGCVVAGTAYAFSNAAVRNRLDYLFVDEAGQVTVANMLAMSAATKNLVFIGDQNQLSQPVEGEHPGKSGCSILEYLLQQQPVVSMHKGIFLPKSYRMHPAICNVISREIYADKLTSDACCQNHMLITSGEYPSRAAGIVSFGVSHTGNMHSSEEEVVVIGELISWLEKNVVFGLEQRDAVSKNDIMVVTPYNAQVQRLRAGLDDRVRVGTVDSFQGQESAIVIFSMCLSDADAMARGALEFLFCRRRLNVAVTRAKALAIIVASERLNAATLSQLECRHIFEFYLKLVESAEEIQIIQPDEFGQHSA